MISKNGIITVPNFYEGNTMDIITSRGSNSYVPVKDKNNSCIEFIATMMYDFDEIAPTDVLRILAKISWSGFDNSSTAGTFAIGWQGANHSITEGWIWAGPNHAASALYSYVNLTNLVLNNQSGSFEYNTTYTVPSSFRETYDGSYLGFRANYSNGVGRITVDNIVIIPDKYYTGAGQTVKAHINNDYISTNNIIEV